MPVSALKTVSTARVCLYALLPCSCRNANIFSERRGCFILQCKRLDFHYSDWAGSSRGMKYDSVRPLATLLSLMHDTNIYRVQTISQVTPLYSFHLHPSPNPDPHLATGQQSSHNTRDVHQRPRESNLCTESGTGPNIEEGGIIEEC